MKNTDQNPLAKYNRRLLTAITVVILLGVTIAFIQQSKTDDERARVAELIAENNDLRAQNQALHKTNDATNNELVSVKEELKFKEDEWNLQLEQHEREKAISERNISRLEAEKREINQLIAAVSEGDTSLQAYILKRKEIDDQLTEERTKSEVMDAEITRLRQNVLKNELLIKNLTEFVGTFRDAHYASGSRLGPGDVLSLDPSARDSIMTDLEAANRQISLARLKLESMENILASYEMNPDSLADSTITVAAYPSLREEITKTRIELDRRENLINETQTIFGTRYVLIQPTDSLIQWGLLRRKGRIVTPDEAPRRRKLEFYKLGISSIKREDCVEVSLDDDAIVIESPNQKLNILMPPSGKHFSFVRIEDTIQPITTTLQINDPEIFWGDSYFAVIELLQ